MITVKSKGDFGKTKKFLKGLDKLDYDKIFEKYGRRGVAALAAATPSDTGNTANSWNYQVIKNKNEMKIEFTNSNIVGGVPLVILLQYGHGTRNGGYVPGRDFINPAIKGILDNIANDIWLEVNRL